MRFKVFIVFVLFVCSLCTNSAIASDWIYATVDFADVSGPDNHLIQIDVNTGAITNIGKCTVTGEPSTYSPGLTGLSMHTDGQLYAFDTYGNQIVTINTKTAVATKVTDVNNLGDGMYGLAIEQNGDYYVTGKELRKGTLPGTTTSTSSEYADTDSCDLAADGTLYATDSEDSDDSLRTIDKTTGAQTLIQTWTDTTIAGIAIDGSFAWAIDNGDNATGNQKLVKIDLSTGNLTYLDTPLTDGYYLATALPNQEVIFFPIKSKNGKTSIIYLE